MSKKKQRTTKKAIEREIKNVEKRLNEIELHTGAQLSLNKDAILNNPDRAKTLQQLKNIDWNSMKEGKSFGRDFVSGKVEGKFWTAKAGWITTETEVQTTDMAKLLKAVAKRERITGETMKISISGEDNIEKAIDFFKYFKNEKQYQAHVNKNLRKVARNFERNLGDMLEYGPEEMTKEQVRKLRHLRAAIRKNPKLWVKFINEHHLFEISGVNMYDSKDISVDLKNNFDDIIEVLETETGVDLDQAGDKINTELQKKERE